jgi:hypothetical protein
VDWNALGTVITAFAALAALLFTGLSLQQTRAQNGIAEQGQITDRYNNAVTNLGSSSLDQRIGGIYALQRIMQDSDRDQDTIVRILSAFVRVHAPLASSASSSPAPRSSASPTSPPLGPSADVAAALDVLISRRHDKFHKVRPDLTNTNLAHVNLFEMDLSGMILTGADFTGAQLFGADLHGANLGGTDFHGAYLAEAHLFDVFVGRADFSGADVSGADFHTDWLPGANFAGADLRRANLNSTLLDGADFTDANLADTDLAHAILGAPNDSLGGTDLSQAKALTVGQVLLAYPNKLARLPAAMYADPRIVAWRSKDSS